MKAKRLQLGTILVGLMALTVAWTSIIAQAQDAAPAKPPTEIVPEKAVSPGTRRALLICGLPGDTAHRKQFAEAMESLHKGLQANHGFPGENIHILWGDEPTEKDGPAVTASQLATRDSIASEVEKIRAEVQPADTLWVIVLGHAHYDNKVSWLNVKGPDLNNVEFGKLFAGLACREQAFFITTPVSGFFARSLSQSGRVIITATEADLEVNETVFPHKLAKLVAEPPALKEFDVNEDGRLSLLDLYLATVRDTLQDYVTNEFLATEHALLDDNGDGRASELQLDYLPEELGGRRRANRPIPAKPTGDGELANRIELLKPATPVARE